MEPQSSSIPSETPPPPSSSHSHGDNLIIKDKNEFIQCITAWVQHDTQLNQLQKQMEEHRHALKQLTPQLLQFIEANGLQNININLNNGESRLRYVSNSTQTRLSWGFLRACLMEYFKPSTTTCDELIQFIQQKRVITQSPSLERIVDKPVLNKRHSKTNPLKKR